MKLRLSNENVQLKLDSTEDLEFQDIFKAYNLVMKRNDSLSVDDNDDDTEPLNLGKLLLAAVKPFQRATHEKVKASVRCRKCGYVGVQDVDMGNRYMFCPKCNVKLFLRPANVEWGAKDARGMTYKAEDVYVDKNSSFKSADSDSDNDVVYSTKEEKVPDEFSSVPEIRAYLNKHHVANEGIHLKPLLVDKLKDVKYSDRRNSND